MNRTVKTAAVQMAPSADRDRNLRKAAELIELAASEGAEIIALPQLFNSEWFPFEINTAHLSKSESADGPSVTAMQEAALKHKSVVIAPIFEAYQGAHFNTAFVIGPDGKIIGRYRKIHIPQIPLWEEGSYFAPGDLGFPVFKTPNATIGVQLCWDVFFPEGFRTLALKGAEIVFTPTASAFYHSHAKWERAIAAAAHSNGFFVFRVNRVGDEAQQEFYGRSFAVHPDGEMLVEPGGAGEGIVVASMDLSEIATTRNEWVFLKGRRPELYKEISKS
ncbi:MAG: acyltransferase [Proteobacteria bacterium]|nr:acyltransferase [Pseudomonadota bacterium]